jgi:hypothetical protein
VKSGLIRVEPQWGRASGGLLGRLQGLPSLGDDHRDIALEFRRDRRGDVHVVTVRQRDFEALPALIRDLLGPGFDRGGARDARLTFALECDELGAQGVALLDQLVGRRRAAAGGGSYGSSFSCDCNRFTQLHEIAHFYGGGSHSGNFGSRLIPGSFAWQPFGCHQRARPLDLAAKRHRLLGYDPDSRRPRVIQVADPTI